MRYHFFPFPGIRNVKIKNKVVALTSDDGPNPPYTERLLSVLETNNISATFFLIGSQVETHPETAQKIIEAGHEIGGHSYDWEMLALKRCKTVEAKLDLMDAAFANAGITNVSLFRPPNGILSLRQEKILEERGLIHIGADVVVGDWKNIDSETICHRVLKKVRPGSIIVLHDGGGDRSSIIEVVPMIIKELHAEGYEIVPAGRMLGH